MAAVSAKQSSQLMFGTFRKSILDRDIHFESPPDPIMQIADITSTRRIVCASSDSVARPSWKRL
jgi:hypothetical protein